MMDIEWNIRTTYIIIGLFLNGNPLLPQTNIHVKKPRKYKKGRENQINRIHEKYWKWITITNNIWCHNSLHHHRPSWRVEVISVLDSTLLDIEAVLESVVLVTKAGCFGIGRLAVSLPSNTTTLDMVGRSLGSSCTHNSPTCTHLNTSLALQLDRSVESIKSNGLPSCHSLHACNII